MEKDWFKSWFDSPYYHILYRDRDDREAKEFMDRLIDYLQPNPGSRILDMPCGKGRHSRYLATYDFDVTGVDLSPESIKEAREHEQHNLHFEVHDMREPFKLNHFHYVLNLFTSFGYFDTLEENAKVLDAVYANLVSGGILVIDFLNSFRVAGNLIPKEEKEIEGIRFQIERKLSKGKIIKTIKFKDQGKWHEYEERVQAISMKEFVKMLNTAGFKLLDHFGDYELNYYHANTSERVILIAAKI
jgi:SAM-dependent methyltransferase